jgi:folate-binding protein YgfZ
MLINLFARAKIRVAGPDRDRYLNGQLTNELGAARLGRTVHGCLLTAKGKLEAEVFVTVTRDDSLIVDSAAEIRESLLARLEKYLVADEVTLTDETDSLALFHVLDLEVSETLLPEGTVSESERFGRAGFDLLLPTTFKHLVPQLLKEDPVSDETVECFRIAQGVPVWGAELSEDVLPPEVGLDRDAISYTKGCYVGQEVISRIKSVGHVNRQLVGVQLVEGPSFAVGDELVAEAGKTIGRLTSVCFQPDKQRWIGLSIIRREFAQPGQRYQIKLRTSQSSSAEDVRLRQGFVGQVGELSQGATEGEESTGLAEVASLPFSE